jgi:dienelactone hydrolase
MKRALILATALAFGTVAHAAIKTETVTYKDGKTELKGYLAYDDAAQGKRAGVLVVPEWTGLNDYAKKRAEQLAGLGYVAFAIDMYGKGQVAKDSEEASKLAGTYKADRPLMRTRAMAGLNTLLKNEKVDPARVAAIGYCFGGTVTLELARAGAPLKGVVCFHGGLDTPKPEETKSIGPKVLVMQGADDPYAKFSDMGAFKDEMTKAGADYQIVVFSGAVHGFTNPANGNDNSKGMAYNGAADRRSWNIMRIFFNEIL